MATTARTYTAFSTSAHEAPGASPGEILVPLAEERADEIEAAERASDPLAGLPVLGGGGPTITRQMVEDALGED